MKNNKKLCGVIGNPIAHSQSPEIHQRFASSCKIELQYEKFLVTHETLSSFVDTFFRQNGTGLNVTLPFKQSVIRLVDKLSDNAELCQSVNTIFIDNSGKLCGDTTDGDGLLMDLDKKEYVFENKNILLIGAGGAAVSAICALLKRSAKVRIVNRSQQKITELINRFSIIGDIDFFETKQTNKFDGVICAISQSNKKIYQSILPTLKSDAYIYDLNYGERAEETLDYFRDKGFTSVSDGYGMLVGQAARSFEIWHGVLPKLD